MASNAINLNCKVLFVITGASRGIGKSIAIECAKKFQPGSVLHLLARSAAGLEDTKSEILLTNRDITVHTFSTDLNEPNYDEFRNVLRTSLFESSFDLALIIHNVGSIGDTTKKANALDNISQWRSYYDLNVFNVAILNSIILDETVKINKKIVVNITSKCAFMPMKSFSFYCSGKAAREMYFKVLAAEQADNGGDLIVLNYAPGPVDTDMISEVESTTFDQDTRDYFRDARDNKIILTPLQTTSKFIQILENGKYQSGDHVDYFD